MTLRVVFSLPLRQTEGFLDSLLRLMGLNLKAPDHTTLSRRNQIVAVPPLTRSYEPEFGIEEGPSGSARVALAQNKPRQKLEGTVAFTIPGTAMVVIAGLIFYVPDQREATHGKS